MVCLMRRGHNHKLKASHHNRPSQKPTTTGTNQSVSFLIALASSLMAALVGYVTIKMGLSEEIGFLVATLLSSRWSSSLIEGNSLLALCKEAG